MNEQEISAKLASLRIRAGIIDAEIKAFEKILFKKTTYTKDELLSTFLSGKQKAICSYIKEGTTLKELACKLDVKVKTIKWHLTRIYSFFGVAGKKELTKLLTSKEFNYEPESKIHFRPILEGPTRGSTESCLRRLHDRAQACDTGTVELPGNNSKSRN